MSGRPRIEREIRSLRTLDRDALADRYQQLYGKSASGSITRDLLEAAVGYRLQKQLIARLRQRLTLTLTASEAITAAVALDHEQTLLIGTWKGDCHVATMLDDGSVDYRGETHASLDAVAERITGGGQSGHQLFGRRGSVRRDQEPSHGR